MGTIFKTLPETGECELDIEKTIEQWENDWIISQWGTDEFKIASQKMKANISKKQAIVLIELLDLKCEKRPVFKSGRTWKK